MGFGGEGVIHNSAFGLMMDHAFACLIEDCAYLQRAWVLAIGYHMSVSGVGQFRSASK